ncbi:calcium-transporting ATPase 10, plasma membrane-type-like, partial [Dioscorea cayenensis subsp. rotundata]|uniref:Calcium-transporting ATPase 10, plasma membrane-type-like n=1 Tax=Dioscorea cayennensis subsp. rotundata TaxID=55577 RepID=A0AB40CMJ4_DIOCR
MESRGAAVSPGRALRQWDEERGSDAPDNVISDDAFDIPAKNASIQRLRRWRQAALVLNASRRFRYTLDLKKEEEKEQIRRKIRAHAQVIRAALLFKEAGEKGGPGISGGSPILPAGGHGIAMEQLTSMTRDHEFSALQEYGGVKGLSDKLKTNLDKGIIEM